MKYEVDVASNGMMFIIDFMEINEFVQKLNGNTHSHGMEVIILHIHFIFNATLSTNSP
jgi:hypothetical protein